MSQRPGASVASADHRADGAGFSSDRIASLLLRGGVAFVFLYAAASMVIQPDAFAGYFPDFMDASSNSELLLASFALYEGVIAVGILSGRYTYAASLLAATTLVGIIIANLDAFQVLFRNVAIACAALAVAVQSRPARSGAGAASAGPERPARAGDTGPERPGSAS